MFILIPPINSPSTQAPTVPPASNQDQLSGRVLTVQDIDHSGETRQISLGQEWLTGGDTAENGSCVALSGQTGNANDWRMLAERGLEPGQQCRVVRIDDRPSGSIPTPNR